MSDRLVVVHTTTGSGPANIVKEMLEAAGIPAWLSQEGAGAAYGLTVGPMGLVDVLVASEHAAEAEALIAAMQRGDFEAGGE
jgi:hypothetical protein